MCLLVCFLYILYKWLHSHILGSSEQNFLKNVQVLITFILSAISEHPLKILFYYYYFLMLTSDKNTYCISARLREMQAICRLHDCFLCYQFWYTEHFNFSFGISGAAVQNTNSCFIISIYFLISDHFSTFTQHIFINRIWIWKDKEPAH